MVMRKLGSVGRVDTSTAARSKSTRVDMAARPPNAFESRDSFATGDTLRISMAARPEFARKEPQTTIRMSPNDPIEADHVTCGSDLFLG